MMTSYNPDNIYSKPKYSCHYYINQICISKNCGKCLQSFFCSTKGMELSFSGLGTSLMEDPKLHKLLN